MAAETSQGPAAAAHAQTEAMAGLVANHGIGPGFDCGTLTRAALAGLSVLVFGHGKLLVHRLSASAVLPVRGSAAAAGYDLASAYAYTVKARGKELVKTDLAIAVPPDTYGRIAPRSGLAWNNSIDVGAGVIDADYRGNVGIVLFNHSDVDFKIAPGDRVAQLILERITTPDVIDVPSMDKMHQFMWVGTGDTNVQHSPPISAGARGAAGFGSTGVSSLAPDHRAKPAPHISPAPHAVASPNAHAPKPHP